MSLGIVCLYKVTTLRVLEAQIKSKFKEAQIKSKCREGHQKSKPTYLSSYVIQRKILHGVIELLKGINDFSQNWVVSWT